MLPLTMAVTTTRINFVLLLIIVLLIYWPHHSKLSEENKHVHKPVLPRSTSFTYANISAQLHVDDSRGILYVPSIDQPSHFASITSKAVRGNHRHRGNHNSVSQEIIILLQGQFQFRIGEGETDKYEDRIFDVTKTGVVALNFSGEKCHALKNIGEETAWFASYYAKIKHDDVSVPVDRHGCRRMQLT
jgi:oxalate decarboxylase/phosphoglucose isomerase-like protein (cupin superfamily)